MGSYFMAFSIIIWTLSFTWLALVPFCWFALWWWWRQRKPRNIAKNKEQEWLDTLYDTSTQEQLQRFDNRLLEKTKPVDLSWWTMEDVLDALRDANLEEYIATFREHRIDGKVLLQLTEKNLKDDLGIYKLGDRKRLQRCFGMKKDDESKNEGQ